MNYYYLVKPFLYCFSPETAHNIAIGALKHNLVPPVQVKEYEALRTRLWGKEFANPIGLAAGFDKNGECISALSRQGFGFIEVGTVTPKPQEGNPKPRLFRLEEDQAIINRMGFNNKGMEPFIANLGKAAHRNAILGANIGKNKTQENATEDYVLLLEKVYGLSDYITVNISSPNTPGLRDLQGKEALNSLLTAILQKRVELAGKHRVHIPIVVKIAPDVSDYDKADIAELALAHQLDGLIISNTTIQRPALQSKDKGEQGGLSGKPLFELSTQVLRDMCRLTQGKIPLIGVGGVSSAEEAYTKIKAGASLVQVYSSLIYQGFGLVEEIKAGLVRLMEQDGVKNVGEVVGRG